MKKRMKKTDNRGFSLIELVIVVSIMAVLTVSISIVASHFIRKARIQAQETNARAIFDATNVAILDFFSEDEGMVAAGNGYYGAEGAEHFTDYDYGDGTDIVGRMTNYIFYYAQKGGKFPDGCSPVDQNMAKRILSVLPKGLNYDPDQRQAQPCNFHDDKVRVIVVYTDKGVRRVEYSQYPGIKTTIENGIKVKKEVYSASNPIKFSHVN